MEMKGETKRISFEKVHCRKIPWVCSTTFEKTNQFHKIKLNELTFLTQKSILIKENLKKLFKKFEKIFPQVFE